MTINNYENLVFRGGGVKSYAYIGALHVLEDNGVLSGVESVAGSSAGALYACLTGLNYSAYEIKNYILNTDLKEEMKASTPDEVLDRFFTQYGNYMGDCFINDFHSFISEKFGTIDLTFKRVHDLKESLGLKDIYLTGVDVSEGKLVVFSYENTPDMKLSDALRISCGYPLMYTPCKGSDGHYYVDGGLLNNYPIEIFNSKEENQQHIANPKTLGLYLGSHNDDEGSLSVNEISSLLNNIVDKFTGANPESVNKYIEQIDFNKINDGIEQPINDIISYLAHLFDVYSKVEYPIYEGLHEITIDVQGINALTLDLSDEQIQNLIHNGTESAENYLSIHNMNTDFVF